MAAHRLILCASSEVFQIMLMSNNWTESSERKIVLKESPACEAVFEVFLKYLYTGKISVDYANVIPILQLADKYNVKDLLRVGLDFMSRNVPLSGRKNQVVSWYQFTTNCGYNKVADMCLNFIKWNFDLVRNSINLCQYSIFWVETIYDIRSKIWHLHENPIHYQAVHQVPWSELGHVNWIDIYILHK